MDYHTKQTDSITWKGIIKSFNMVKGGFGWDLSDGAKISLLFGIWLHYDPLCLVVDDIDLDEICWTVKDIIGVDGEWKLENIKSSLLRFILDQICNIEVSSDDTRQDMPIWK